MKEITKSLCPMFKKGIKKSLTEDDGETGEVELETSRCRHLGLFIFLFTYSLFCFGGSSNLAPMCRLQQQLQYPAPRSWERTHELV